MSSMNIIIGPQHPALAEAEKFTFKVEGEYVVDVEPRLGYMHRGIEKLAEQRTYIQDIFLVERICGICNVPHTLVFCQAVESLADITVPPRALYLRTIVAELNRLHSHLLLLGLSAHLLGFDTLFMYIWRDREAVMDAVERITGNRVLSAYNTFGGVRRDITEENIEFTRKVVNSLPEKVAYYKKVFVEDPTLRMRTVGIGRLSKSKALDLCAVGPVARGSGVRADVRLDDPYAAYGEVPFDMVVYEEGDVWSRLMIRCDEIIEIIKIINYCLDHLPPKPYRARVPALLTPPAGRESMSRVEAPRGELIHHVFSDGSEKPYRVKVRTPTLANIPAVIEMLKGGHIADIPASLASIDPCFCCTDRVTIVDIKKGSKESLTLEDIRRKYTSRR